MTGYGSVNDTFKQAYKIDPSIKLSNVREHLNKYQHRQTHFQHKKHNSFVSPRPLFGIEIGSVDMSTKASGNEGFRYGCVVIDNFTRYAWVVPIKTKKPHDVTRARQEIMYKIGVPIQLYSDREGSFNNVEFIR